MLVYKERIHLISQKRILPTDNVITVSKTTAMRINTIGVGNHIYLTIALPNQPSVFEVVRYTHTTDIGGGVSSTVDLAVTRDVDNTGRKSFPPLSCIVSELGATQLAEYIAQATGV